MLKGDDVKVLLRECPCRVVIATGAMSREDYIK
jgi:hypothetical protein